MTVNNRGFKKLISNKLWVLDYQIEEIRIATNAHLAKLRTTSKQAIRRLKHDRR